LAAQKILLIEDDRFIRDMYTTVLSKAGFDVKVAINGSDALAKAQAFSPDVLLIDIMIPEKSGLELLKIFRNDPKYNSINAKMIILTNISADDTAEQVKALKADGYIVKADIMPSELVERIKSLA